MSFHTPLGVTSSSKGGAIYLKVIAQEARFGEMNASMSDRLTDELVLQIQTKDIERQPTVSMRMNGRTLIV
jgi:hypothetical protein